MNNIELNIFTNSTASAPDTRMIESTYLSFCDTFPDDIPVKVWCDPHPNIKAFPEYITRLKKLFPVVIPTQSLSDGYVKSVKESDAEFLFQLEGDWRFNDNINHGLNDIIEFMSVFDLYHYRFNKRKNSPAGWDKDFKAYDTFCTTSNLSNNPHIIHRKKWIEKCLPYVKILPGSKGLEEQFLNKGLTGAIYGGEDYPATIIHLDGRKAI